MGADYKKGVFQHFHFTAYNGNVAAGGTRYFTHAEAPANVANPPVLMVEPGILDLMNAGSTAAAGAGETFTYTVMVNGAPVALTCQIGGALQDYAEDLVNEAAVQRGDRVCIRIVTSGAAVATVHRSSLRFRRI